MSVQIYNSLTRQKELLDEKIEGKTVRIYSCGVTVYDKCHIGHARSLYVFEVIRRYLKYRGYDVRFVRNITDIDDKIINKAKELNKDWKEVVRENIDGYHHDMKLLGVPEADVEPRATENIDIMEEYIARLIEQGFAYEVEGDVYFSVRKYNEKFPYGKLSGQSIEQMQEAVRIEKDEKKKDPLDFALWKKSKEDEPSWPSPWGQGRPGWHIECSCMSRKHLGCETLDIHAGGRDLIFPHHENEIAQAQAYNGKEFAKMWIHHGLLTIDKQKMAKSLGNFITIEDAVEKYGANVLKMFFLGSHYRSNMDFTEEKMEEAKKEYEKIKEILVKLHALNIATGGSTTTNLTEFIAAMDDDFNTPKALAALFDIIHNFWKVYQSGEVDKIVLKETMHVISVIVDVFCLNFLQDAPLDPREEHLIKERETARKNKDFKKADELRITLLNLGIVIKDTPSGTEWKKQ